ncbi:hypothetical protein [Natrarchaeobius chitinivorans]|uniref:Uncharacterized protein n=1 Tax=Natrarchaeobius chitinivorans TaxID=1679083 RepID=A0A3N6LX12_NATCH|nr:hypothetical protein [Natrarchaeobius chitinivorans]RQG92284.1 hypothetical protein EA473_17440 [Natrarchaeobius chitinivorans]
MFGAVAVFSLLIGFVLGGYVSAPEEPEVSPEPTAFTAESSLYDERIVHTFTPKVDQLLEYRVSYHVQSKPGPSIETVENRTESLSSDTPLVIEIENREPDTEYWVDIRIFDEFDRLVFDARISVGR